MKLSPRQVVVLNRVDKTSSDRFSNKMLAPLRMILLVHFYPIAATLLPLTASVSYRMQRKRGALSPRELRVRMAKHRRFPASRRDPLGALLQVGETRGDDKKGDKKDDGGDLLPSSPSMLPAASADKKGGKKDDGGDLLPSSPSMLPAASADKKGDKKDDGGDLLPSSPSMLPANDGKSPYKDGAFGPEQGAHDYNFAVPVIQVESQISGMRCSRPLGEDVH